MQRTTVITTTQPSAPMLATSTVHRPDFNDNDPSYIVKCCHVKKWAYFIGGYDMGTLVAVVIFVLFAVFDNADRLNLNTAGCVFALIGVVCVAVSLLVLLWQGLKLERPNYVIVYLILLWFWIGFWIIVTIILFISLFSYINGLVVFVFLFIGANVVFRVCLQTILHKTHKYIRDKEARNLTGVVLSQPNMPLYNAPPQTFIQTSYGSQNVTPGASYNYSTPVVASTGPAPVMPQPYIEEAPPPAYDDVVKN